MPWYLNKKDWQDCGKHGSSLFIVSEELRISIKLETRVGYLGEVDLMTARPAAIQEAKGLVRRFMDNNIPSDEIISKVVGKRAFPNPIVT